MHHRALLSLQCAVVACQFAILLGVLLSPKDAGSINLLGTSNNWFGEHADGTWALTHFECPDLCPEKPLDLDSQALYHSTLNLESTAPWHCCCCRIVVSSCWCATVMLLCCCIAVLLHDHIVMLLRHHAVVSAGVSTKSSEKIREMTPGHAEMLLEKIACCLDKEPSGSWSVEGCHIICGVGE